MGPPGGGLPGAPQGNGIGARTASPPTQEDVFGLLKSNVNRRFKTDIETDSTIAGDESQEKQDRQGFIESMTKFMEAWGPMVMQKPELSPLAGQLLLFGVRAFRVGRELEEVIEETVDRMGQAPQGQQEDPKVTAEKVKLQGTQMKAQGEQQKAQTEAQTKQQESAIKLKEIIVQSEARIREAQMKLAAMEQAHGHKIAEGQMEHAAAMDQMALERQKAQTAQVAAQTPKWPAGPQGNDQGF
jgi:hypothetical protein